MTTPRWVGLGLIALLAVAALVLGATTVAWGDGLRDEQRLLPGTTIASVEVGGLPMPAAVQEVEARLTDQLDRIVTVTHGDERWEVTARDLGADSDAEQVVATAFERTQDASLRDLARIRWAGGAADVDLDVKVEIPADEVEGFIASLADELDLEPHDATLTWNGEAAEVGESRTGLQVDREAATAGLTEALDGASETVELPVGELQPATATETARQVAAEVEARVEQALGHAVTVRLGDRSWGVTPRDLDATVAAEPLLEAGLAAAGDLDAIPSLDLDVSEDAIAGFVANIASEVDRPSRDAQVAVQDGELLITPEQDGLALDRAAVRRELQEALAGGGDQVTATTSVTKASVTSSSFGRVLYLNQAARQVALIEGGEVVRSWPVAVGMGGSPTPTGTFTVGAKRYEPTWYNPAQDRWGADMPAQMGPGPDNPLGARAINWNRNGRDTLIRFHGTPNESSVGEAASRGCVRMFNEDVIELYDLVSTGTTIISVAG
jgi:lipoprotein-anchoring transpeptidase ErfK/SrfK